jgi:NAD(P)H-nitrite reductase large subunit
VKRYVIVGNGTAAAGAIEGIRDTDKEGSITVISEEMHPVYSRPLISYLLEGKTDEERMSYRDSDFYDRNGCSVIYGKKATGIRDDIREVYLSDGTVVPYDELLIATGSSPFVPPFKGLDTVEERYSFMTLDDALLLREAVKEDTRVFIVGGGLIGLKCAEGLSSITKDITVTDLQENILSSILDTASSKLMQKHLEENGITFLLGDSAERFEVDKAYMRTGKTVEFDVLVLAVGVRPNISLIKDIGGETGRAITVNCRM